MSKLNVFAHTTGNHKEGNFEHNGYFTKEDGKGTKVKSVMAAGNGVYFDRSKLNDDEIAEVKSLNFNRLAGKRTTKTVLAIRSLINTANKAAYNWSEEQADDILNVLAGEMLVLENKLRDVRKEKEGKTGYSFSFSE